MSDFDDDLINDAFAGFSAAAAPSVRAAGTGAVRQTIKRRRTRNTAALSVLGALLLVVPVAAYASMDRGNQGPPQVATSVEATVSPSASASPSPSASAMPSGPDGRLTLAQLTSMKIEVPKWEGSATRDCASGQVKLPKIKDIQHYVASGSVGVFAVAHTNLDGDAALETAVLIACKTGEASSRRVLAFDRDDAGKVVMKGIVAEGIIWSITANALGGVDADVSDYQVCCDTPKAIELHQTRTYGWDGSAFAQLGGPTSFQPHDGLIDLAVSVKDVTWGKAEQIEIGGYTIPHRTATVVLKVVNKGPVASGGWVALLGDSGSAVALGGIGQACPALAAGESAEVTVKFRVPESDFNYGTGTGLWIYELGTIGIGYDRNKDDNRTTAAFPR
jgi:hypothetical protein